MTWDEILEEVKSFRSTCRYVWYRGQSSTTYELKSSLFRQTLRTVDEFLVNERARYNYFKNLGHLYHNLDEWDLVYLMQHHGVKTRLMDWTESFSMALYFASNSWREGEPISIWLLNPQKLNYKTFENYKFWTPNNDSYRNRLSNEDEARFFNNSVALHPIRSNSRIVAQQGVFTIQGNTLSPLNEEFNGSLITEGILKEIRIDYIHKEEVKNFLELAGENHFTVFPDLQGLAKYVNNITDNKV